MRASDAFVRRVLVVTLVAAIALALWKTADVLLVAFGGVLLAVALRACADLLTRWTPLRKRYALPVAVLLIVLLLGLLAWGIGGTLAGQFDELAQQLPAAFGKLREWLDRTELGRVALGSFGSVDGVESAAKLVGVALGTLNAVANLLLLLVVGIYLAADPGLYFRGTLRLLPQAVRPRASAALSNAGATLRNWLGGQLVAMLIVGVLTFAGLAALGVPLALSLATIAAALEFVPFVGPILAAIPAVLIAFCRRPGDRVLGRAALSRHPAARGLRPDAARPALGGGAPARARGAVGGGVRGPVRAARRLLRRAAHHRRDGAGARAVPRPRAARLARARNLRSDGVFAAVFAAFPSSL